MAIPARTAQPGTFFVTTATYNRRRLFQVTANAELVLETLQHYRREGRYLLHAFVVMPDHLHLLITPQAITLERATRYTSAMALNVDAQTEQRIQQQIERGPYTGPADVINHAMDLLAAETHCTPEEQQQFNAFVQERMAEITRRDSIPGDKVRELLAQERAARTT